jgi:hypothetical protein
MYCGVCIHAARSHLTGSGMVGQYLANYGEYLAGPLFNSGSRTKQRQRDSNFILTSLHPLRLRVHALRHPSLGASHRQRKTSCNVPPRDPCAHTLQEGRPAYCSVLLHFRISAGEPLIHMEQITGKCDISARRCMADQGNCAWYSTTDCRRGSPGNPSLGYRSSGPPVDAAGSAFYDRVCKPTDAASPTRLKQREDPTRLGHGFLSVLCLFLVVICEVQRNSIPHRVPRRSIDDMMAKYLRGPA